MSAPSAALVSALRAGTVSRHLFFRMTHSQGTVLAWDGVGKFQFDAGVAVSDGVETYNGVAGFASLEGVSDSGDIQNHEIVATLNGVSLESILETDQNVRDEDARIFAVWIQEDGTVLESQQLFHGRGDTFTARLSADEKSISVRLRAPLANWSTPPRAYYTDKDQQRRFPGDTGFKFMKSLENTSVTGWGIDPESVGGSPRWIEGVEFRTAVGFEIIGDDADGLEYLQTSLDPHSIRYPTKSVSSEIYREQSTNLIVSVDEPSNGDLIVDSARAYVDTDGVLRSPAGHKLIVEENAAQFLRVQGLISAIGSATSERITYDGQDLRGETNGLRVYCNHNGKRARQTNDAIKDYTDSVAYVEQGTGLAAAFVGGILKVNGSDCTISSTGAVRTASGAFVVKQIGSTSEFLRQWT